MLNPVATSIIVSVFTDRGERARAIGVWGSAIGITMAAGSVLGSLLVSRRPAKAFSSEAGRVGLPRPRAGGRPPVAVRPGDRPR
jgi:MFS family permease